jgi:hypothetical protein
MKRPLVFRIEEYEFQIVEEYCKSVGRTKIDLLRELIRGLKLKKNGSPELMVISLSNQKSKLIRDS